MIIGRLNKICRTLAVLFFNKNTKYYNQNLWTTFRWCQLKTWLFKVSCGSLRSYYYLQHIAATQLNASRRVSTSSYITTIANITGIPCEDLSSSRRLSHICNIHVPSSSSYFVPSLSSDSSSFLLIGPREGTLRSHHCFLRPLFQISWTRPVSNYGVYCPYRLCLHTL